MKNVVEFKEIFGKNFPSITTLVNSSPDEHKETIVNYLKKGKHVAESPSRATDFVTGKPLGIPLSMQSDGVYTWRSDVTHYYENYNIKLNTDFINYVLSQ